MELNAQELKVIEDLLHFEELKLLSTIDSLEDDGLTPTKRLCDKQVLLATLLLKIRKSKSFDKSPCN